jgi:hypothetical protein
MVASSPQDRDEKITRVGPASNYSPEQRAGKDKEEKRYYAQNQKEPELECVEETGLDLPPMRHFTPIFGEA